MRALIFSDLKQIYIIQDEFLCETAFQWPLGKNTLVNIK